MGDNERFVTDVNRTDRYQRYPVERRILLIAGAIPGDVYFVNTQAGMTPLPEGGEITVRLLKHPRPDVEYPARVISDDGDHVVVRAPWSGPDVHDLGYVRFEKGDVFTEHFWRSRWFSVKEVRAASGELKGWYCDVARPALVEPGAVVAADLDLDVWLSGDGTTLLRLDEDEFAESGLAEREPETAAAALRAVAELEKHAAAGFAGLLDWR
jgi:Protein of unknown function (DUF402)